MESDLREWCVPSRRRPVACGPPRSHSIFGGPFRGSPQDHSHSVGTTTQSGWPPCMRSGCRTMRDGVRGPRSTRDREDVDTDLHTGPVLWKKNRNPVPIAGVDQQLQGPRGDGRPGTVRHHRAILRPRNRRRGFPAPNNVHSPGKFCSRRPLAVAARRGYRRAAPNDVNQCGQGVLATTRKGAPNGAF